MKCANCGLEDHTARAAFCSRCGGRLIIDAASCGGPDPAQEQRDPAEEASLAAAHLAHSLKSGWMPTTVPAAIARYDGEEIYASTSFQLFCYSGANVNYRRRSFIGFGSPLFLAATLGGSLLYNSAQKTKAQAAAAAQWRLVNEGIVHVTDRRFALQGRLRWDDIFYSSIKATECLDDGIVIMVDGQAPLKLSTTWPEYYFVLFNWLGFRNIPEVQLTDRLRERLRTRGIGEGPSHSVVDAPPDGPNLTAAC